MSFAESLEMGMAGETLIDRWLRGRGCVVLPAYEKIIDNGKGPRLYTPTRTLIAPDLLVFETDRVAWVEAKHKAAFSLYRKDNRWTTGIDLRHYADYCQVDEDTPWPVWLFFLHDGGQAKDSPADSPAGLFGNLLSYLRDHENHRSDRWGPSGMVYWALESLRLLAAPEEIEILRETVIPHAPS